MPGRALSITFTVTCLIQGILLALSAIFQMNDLDGDGLKWLLLYGFGAVLMFCAVFRNYPIPLILVALVVCGIAMVRLYPGVAVNIEKDFTFGIESGPGMGMSPERPWIEQSREFFGSALMALFLRSGR